MTRLVKLGVTLLILAILIALLLIPMPTLVLSVQNGDPVLLLPLVFDKSFTLEYTHSALKTPVQENFILAPGNKLILTSTIYQSLGVGLPFGDTDGHFIDKNGQFVLEGLDRQFEQINQGFMPVAKQTLIYRGKRYPYKNYFAQGSLVRVQVEKHTPVKFLWRKLQVVRG